MSDPELPAAAGFGMVRHMRTRRVGLWSKVPDLAAALRRYEAQEPQTAPFVVVGVIRAEPIGMAGGVLAWASNEFHAHLLKRYFARLAVPQYGVGVLRTPAHPAGATFDIAEWRARMDALPADCRDGDVALLA